MPQLPQISQRSYTGSELAGGHVSLGKPLRALIFVGLVGPALLILILAHKLIGAGEPHPLGVLAFVAWSIVVGIVVSGLRLAAQWERGVVLRLGKFRAVKGPGILYIIPFFEYVRFVDIRILALNIPKQKVITKDNVPAEVDSVLFFRVSDAERAVVGIQDYQFSISQYAQASLRDVVGGLSLDELLSEREQIQQRLAAVVEERIKDWGVHVDSIRLQDIEMPEDLKRMMSRQASAEREKRATITKAEGDKIAAFNLSEAAATMFKSPGAMQLRTLQTIDGLGPTPSNTVIIFPSELSAAARELAEYLNGSRVAKEGTKE